MKCKECKSCCYGWFPSKPNKYVCIGVKEPFVIDDIDAECTEYPEKNKDIVVPKMTLTYLSEQEIRDIYNAIRTLEAIKQRGVLNEQPN